MGRRRVGDRWLLDLAGTGGGDRAGANANAIARQQRIADDDGGEDTDARGLRADLERLAWGAVERRLEPVVECAACDGTGEGFET